MEDTISTVGSAIGYPILGVALVLLWRLYVEVRKDRDYWRARALDEREAVDEALDAAEVLLKPLNRVRTAAKAKPADGPTRKEQVESVVEYLLRSAAEEEVR